VIALIKHIHTHTQILELHLFFRKQNPNDSASFSQTFLPSAKKWVRGGHPNQSQTGYLKSRGVKIE
jgi:hypothetical protein